jgi:mannose-6-phosphate isomerase-like protein (cupin superfamily)
MDNDAVPLNRATVDHYTWGAGCDGWHFLRTPTLSVITERMPPGTAETAHRHARAQQLFYVLGGTLVIVTPVTTLSLAAGEGAHIPPGVIHQVRNDAGTPADFLVISEPPTQADRENTAVPGSSR